VPAPNLILVNGPPAAGKSTLAARYADDHPMALNLDIDVLRGLLGRWSDDRGAAGLRARSLALAAARDHLAAGYDVIVPQLLGAAGFIEALEGLAADVGAAFHEIFLRVPYADAAARFVARAGRDPSAPRDRPAVFDDLYERTLDLLAERPGTAVIPTGSPEATYAELVAAIRRG
jgi:predicted kinase